MKDLLFAIALSAAVVALAATDLGEGLSQDTPSLSGRLTDAHPLASARRAAPLPSLR